MTTKSRKKTRKWLIFLVLAIVLAASLLAWRFMLSRQADPLANVRSTKATTGSIEKTVAGTGNLKILEQTETITVIDGLVIDSVLVEAGDFITAGDQLATFDAQALQAAIWDTQAELNQLDRRLNQLKDQTESQYIISNVAGRIKQIFLAEGDDIQTAMASHGALMILSLDGKLQVTIPASAKASLTTGDKVSVTLSSGEVLEGTVRKAGNDEIDITVSDRTAAVGETVTVSLDSLGLGDGQLTVSQPLAITATDGIAGELLYDLNAKVSSGTKLIKLSSAPGSKSYQQLYSQRQELAGDLATLLGYASQGALLADQSGEVLAIGLAEGAATGSPSAAAANLNSAAFTIRTVRDMRLTINIDELDIAALAVDQIAKITMDALPALSLPGTILEIAEAGTFSQSGAVFAVSLDLPEQPGLKEGMTATAVITVNQRDNVVKIPLEALQESGSEQFVYVGTAISVTEPGEKRLVETGISDGEFVEIISGLADGEIINYYFASDDQSRFPFQGGGFPRPGSTTAD